MLGESIGYPFEGEQTGEIFLIGGLLSLATGVLLTVFLIIGALTLGLGLILLPLAFIPTLGILGYYVRVLRSTAKGEDEPPTFDELGTAFKDGLFATAIGVFYYLVPLMLFLIFGVIGSSGSDIGSGMGVAGILVTGLLTVVLTYVYPAALTRYALTDTVGSAFAFSELRTTVASLDYLFAWGFGVVIFSVGSILASIVGIIPLMGWVVAPVIQFVFAIMAYRAFGVAYVSANGTDTPSTGAVTA